MYTKEDIKEFVIIVTGLGILAYFLKSIVIITTVLVLLLAALLSPKIFKLILLLWKKLAQGLGYVNTRIILFLLFFIIITPYAFIMKIFTKNKFNSQGERSQFVNFKHLYSKNDFDNMW